MGSISRRIEQLEQALEPEKLAEEAYEYFRNITPRRTGNARSKTRRVNEEIRADYPYAQRLDQGYSPQAPRGMTEPTLKFIQEYIRKQGR
jgi:hypothetical protein